MNDEQNAAAGTESAGQIDIYAVIRNHGLASGNDVVRLTSYDWANFEESVEQFGRALRPYLAAGNTLLIGDGSITLVSSDGQIQAVVDEHD